MRGTDLLDASFVLDFFEQNHERLNLAEHHVDACQIFPLKVSKTGGKAIVECRLIVEPIDGGDPEPLSLVAVWRPDGENAQVFELMQRLRRWGFDGSGPQAVCEPVAYLEDCNLLLLAKVDGLELERVLAAKPGGAEAAVVGAAQWLSRLHATPVRSTRPHTFASERLLLERWVRDLDDLYPKFGPRLARVGRILLEAERLVKRSRFRLIHGDFHPENIFVAGERVTVTDFERSCLFDPAQDLGFFLCQLAVKAQMGRYAMDAHEVARLGRRFLEAYGRESPEELSPRVGLHQARSFIEVAHYIFVGLGVPPAPEQFDFYLGRAEACAREVA